jgi:hypothetical protein
MSKRGTKVAPLAGAASGGAPPPPRVLWWKGYARESDGFGNMYILIILIAITLYNH